jgi:hypothetical protein
MAMKTLLICFLFFPLCGMTQFTDQFLDSNFSHHPTWIGDSASFGVSSSYQLQLNAKSGTKLAHLATRSKAIERASWEWYTSLHFNPSSSNFVNIWLVSVSPQIDQMPQGYFVKIGGTEDEVSLYYNNGIKSSKIIDGKNQRLNMNPVTVRIKVERKQNGQWSLYSDSSGSFTYSLEGSVFHDSLSYSKWFGVQCAYTSSRSNSFYFDDFIVQGLPYIDTFPPQLDTLVVLSEKSLLLTFNEAMDTSSSLWHRCVVNKGIGSPNGVFFTNNDYKTLRLSFNVPFLHNEEHLLTIPVVQDTSGNYQKDIKLVFKFQHGVSAHFQDVVFNEVMVDPSPSQGLPEEEYIELYNRSTKTISLFNWTLSDPTVEVAFPNVLMSPNEYLIICDIKSEKDFKHAGKTIGVESFPNLNNTSDILWLKDSSGQLIAHLHYDQDWYGDPAKSQGGWSLEKIDAMNNCPFSANWKAATAASGGTPGKLNSISLTAPHEQAQVQAVEVWDGNLLSLLLTTFIDTALLSSSSFLIENVVIENWGFDTEKMRLRLYLKDRLLPGRHRLEILDLSDCYGRQHDPQSFFFFVPSAPQPNDVVINEILFNPETGGSDYVELFNRSSKILDLRAWRIGNGHIDEDSTRYSKQLTSDPYLLFPKEYVVLTRDSISLQQYYPWGSPRKILRTDLPTFPDNDGEVTIYVKNSVLDRFRYAHTMHFPMLKNVEGVSLERVHYDRSTTDLTNWHSASSLAGFGTPGYENSQFNTSDHSTKTFYALPAIFSPDNDGFQDILTISYQLPETGYAGSVQIYSENGVLVRQLLNNASFSQSGKVSWDGIDEKGLPSAIGIYVIKCELYHPKGKIIHELLPCVLAKKIN